MCYKMQELLSWRHLGSSLVFFGGVRVAHLLSFCVVLLCVYTFLVPCYDVRYDFRTKTKFGSPILPVVCRRARVLFTLFVFACVLWCVFILFVLCTLCCQFSGLSIFHCPFGVLWCLFPYLVQLQTISIN